MSSPEGYPMLAVDGNQTYQLAHIATMIVEALSRHRATRTLSISGWQERHDALRDAAVGTRALSRATRQDLSQLVVPRPLDRATHQHALDLLNSGPQRSAEVVALDAGRLAVVGTVPGVGPVSAEVGTPDLAHQLRAHFLTAPVEQLTAWRTTDAPVTIPKITTRHETDVADFVDGLDPGNATHRSVAAALHGLDPGTDRAVERLFRGVNPAPVRGHTVHGLAPAPPRPASVPPAARPAAPSATAAPAGSARPGPTTAPTHAAPPRSASAPKKAPAAKPAPRKPARSSSSTRRTTSRASGTQAPTASTGDTPSPAPARTAPARAAASRKAAATATSASTKKGTKAAAETTRTRSAATPTSAAKTAAKSTGKTAAKTAAATTRATPRAAASPRNPKAAPSRG